MAWQAPHFLGGPVLHWELVRATRRLWPKLLHYGYAGWLLVQFLVFFSGFSAEPDTSTMYGRVSGELSELDVQRARVAAWRAFAADYVSLFFHQQLILILLVTPAVTAGALGHEKERGTLQLLFGTGLNAWEIVIGKFLGRLAVLARTLSVGLPVLVIVTVLAEVEVDRVLLALAQAAVATFALAAACMLSSVWTRQTRDAILACYATVTLVYLGGLTLLGNTPLPLWLNPVEVLQALCTRPYAPLRMTSLILHFAVLTAAGVLCLALAMAWLRRASLYLLERLPSRWLWAFRPRVGDNPVRWRERYVIGLAPLPWLRMVPTWLGMLGVFSFSAILAYTALPRLVGHSFFPALLRGDLAYVQERIRRADADWIHAEVVMMGIILLVIGNLVVGVRCSTSIAEEKRRKTWEDLIMTPLSLDEIVQGKMWGVLQATPRYLVMYLLPMLALAALGGISEMVVAASFVVGAGFTMLIIGAIGMSISASSEKATDDPLRIQPYVLRRSSTFPGNDWEPIELKPFFTFDAPRQVDRADLPYDLIRFYTYHEGVGLGSNSDYPVRLCQLYEVRHVACQDVLALNDGSPEGWEWFSGIRIGTDSWLNHIVYVLDAPCCQPGAIMLFGPAVAGPGGNGPHQLKSSLVLAVSLMDWLANMQRFGWKEYGSIPGAITDLVADQKEWLLRHYRALNPKIRW